MFVETVELALWEGCGKSLADAVNSATYTEAQRRQQQLTERYPPSSDEALALRTGHLEMGRLLNSRPERDALNEARVLNLQEGHNPDIRALIVTLGTMLIDAAGQCLPDEAIQMAADWRGADAAGQIEIARNMQELLKSAWQAGGLRNEENFPRLAYSWLEDRLFQPPDRFLPKRYRRWKTEGATDPNCIGKAQMLAAFAKMAGAKAYCMAPLMDIHDVHRKIYQELKWMVRQDATERNLLMDQELAHAIEVDDRYDWAQRGELPGFHVGIAIELRDGRFILVDPHSLNWGVFPEAWRMQDADRLLQKYVDVLPGLSIQVHDHGAAKTWREKYIAEAHRLLTMSRELQAAFDATGGNPYAIIAAYQDSPYMDFVLQDINVPEENKAAIGRDVLAMAIMFGLEDPFASFRFAEDEEFRAQKIGSWLTYAHYVILQNYGDDFQKAQKEGELLHPAFEVCNAVPHIGLQVINSLTLNNKHGLEMLFVREASDQLVLRNTIAGYVHGSGVVTRAVAARATAALREMPILHQGCKQILELTRWF